MARIPHDYNDRRYWLSEQQSIVVAGMKRREASEDEIGKYLRRVARYNTPVEQTEEPFDQTVRVKAATAGMVGTGLGAEAVTKPSEGSEDEEKAKEE